MKISCKGHLAPCCTFFSYLESVASIYQANLVIEIPNITENYVNSHLFTCRHWVAACLFKYTSRCWGVFLIGQIFFYSEGLGAKRNASGKLGMKLAIV